VIISTAIYSYKKTHSKHDIEDQLNTVVTIMKIISHIISHKHCLDNGSMQGFISWGVIIILYLVQ